MAHPDDAEEERDPTPREKSGERADSDGPAGGSGTAGPSTPEKEQAGSYARDAEQDPERERHGRDDAE